MIWVFIVPIALLLIGLADLPTGYYTLVRIVVCLVSIFASYLSYKSDEKVGIATVSFALLAILFNPIIPIYLQDKGIWTVIDLIAAVLFGGRFYFLLVLFPSGPSRTCFSGREAFLPDSPAFYPQS